MGGHAEYVRLPAEGSLCRKPESETFAEAAAAADGATTALFFLRDKAGVRPGQRVLVNGASGSIGTHAVQWPSISVPWSPPSAARRTSRW
ncbi:hypothetical protein [Lentzea jiangxiensis]|uniref:hypothetical protein n=1 Tax=Lentzea jiangxiensis TaxID=641025 RepID=UPI001C409A99|nr:hypothetical protein [Lentzea jiangxiensis]